MKKISFAIIITAIAAAGVLIISFQPIPEPAQPAKIKTAETYPGLFFTYDVIRYPASAEISDISKGNVSIAFNITPGSIDFGSVPAMGASKRTVNISAKDSSKRIVIKSYGNISAFLSVSDGDFMLNASKEISLTFSAGNNTAGWYSGEIDIIAQRSNFGPLQWIFGY